MQIGDGAVAADQQLSIAFMDDGLFKQSGYRVISMWTGGGFDPPPPGLWKWQG